MKRGELKEAMQIYELALNGRPDDMKSVSERRKAEMIHPMTKSVTLRDMGMIYERWGDDDKALQLYEESLAFVMKNRQQEMTRMQENEEFASYDVDSNKFGRSFLARSRSAFATAAAESSDLERVSCGSEGELEVYLETSSDMLRAGSLPGFGFAGQSFNYDDFFPPMGGDKKSKSLRGKKDKKAKAGKGDREGSDVNVAITLHQIAQINRRRGHHTVALSAYQVALRGMKQALGDRHPNVAAILGNLGNLYKDMDKFDEAYGIYQEVLSIETHHLGLSHPEVSITLHNIATIESSRGRYSDAINLYTQVIKMQKSLFGPNHMFLGCSESKSMEEEDLIPLLGDNEVLRTTWVHTSKATEFKAMSKISVKLKDTTKREEGEEWNWFHWVPIPGIGQLDLANTRLVRLITRKIP